MSAVMPEKDTQTPQQPAPMQAPAPVQKKNKVLKVAVIGLAVMLIIILSEVGYLVFSGYGRTYFQLKSEAQEETTETPVASASPMPTSIPSLEVPLLKDNALQSSKIDNFLYILDHLESRESFFKTVAVNVTYEAIVIDTSREGTEGTDFRYIINAKDDQGTAIGFRFSKEEIDAAEIFLVSNDNEKISFDDIKPNDKLTVKVTSDLLDNSPNSKLILEIGRGD